MLTGFHQKTAVEHSQVLIFEGRRVCARREALEKKNKQTCTNAFHQYTRTAPPQKKKPKQTPKHCINVPNRFSGGTVSHHKNTKRRRFAHSITRTPHEPRLGRMSPVQDLGKARKNGPGNGNAFYSGFQSRRRNPQKGGWFIFIYIYIFIYGPRAPGYIKDILGCQCHLLSIHCKESGD